MSCSNNCMSGGGILGQGKDGCIVDSINSSNYAKKNGYVAKLFGKNVRLNFPLYKALVNIDPNEERFSIYNFEDNWASYINDDTTNLDIIQCKQIMQTEISNIAFIRYYEPLTTLTKIQYRYLRESIKILHSHNITHGDLPGNVMINPINHMPIIIDWENAKLEADSFSKSIDNNAFLNHFKAEK